MTPLTKLSLGSALLIPLAIVMLGTILYSVLCPLPRTEPAGPAAEPSRGEAPARTSRLVVPGGYRSRQTRCL